MSLTNLQRLALAKAVNTRSREQIAARSEVEPGQYTLDPFTIRVSGELTVGEDETYVPTTGVSLTGATCLAIRRMGIQRENFLKVLKEVCTEALAADAQTRSALMADANVKEFERAFRAEFTSQLPSSTRKGKVLGDISVESVPAPVMAGSLVL